MIRIYLYSFFCYDAHSHFMCVCSRVDLVLSEVWKVLMRLLHMYYNEC